MCQWLILFSLLSFDARANATIPQLIAQNRLEEAASLCRAMETFGTADPNAVFHCAWAYFKAGRNELGEITMQRLSSKPSGTPYLLLSALKYVRNKDYENAKKTLENLGAVKDTPEGLTAQELYAEIYELTGQITVAGFLYKQIVAADPKRGSAHWGLSRYYTSTGEVPKAKFHLEQTALLWPTHINSRFELAKIYLKEDNMPSSVRWISEAHNLDKSNVTVLETIGVLFERRGKISEAIRYWQRAREVQKNSQLATEKLSLYSVQVIDALVSRGDYGRGLLEIEKFGNINNQPKLLLRRGLIQKNLGRFEKASADLLVYVRSNPKDSSAIQELGVCYLNQNRFESAVEEFLRAIELDPQEGLHYAWLGYALESQERLRESRQAWQKALEFLKDPADVEKANRRLATIEQKIQKRDAKAAQKNREGEYEE